MNKSIDIYKLKMVKESEFSYEVSKTVRNSEDVVQVFKALGFNESPEELCGMLSLNVKGEIIGYHEISHGGLSSTEITPRECFKRAFLNNAAAVIFAHNHPSGDRTPSEDDIDVTERLVKAGELLGVKVIDHIVLGDPDYTSMRAEGLIRF